MISTESYTKGLLFYLKASSYGGSPASLARSQYCCTASYKFGFGPYLLSASAYLPLYIFKRASSGVFSESQYLPYMKQKVFGNIAELEPWDQAKDAQDSVVTYNSIITILRSNCRALFISVNTNWFSRSTQKWSRSRRIFRVILLDSSKVS